ncbi:Pou domain-N-terminal to homeobox domain-containing protein [Bacillus sp. OV322]|uniref:helix-turn-helix domain-containing protein n=1 Tax=Bacillus sp. OV322 TaxID=1882764 RepID=UPI0008E71791|nr:helix-turn-helix transcriptional regulator [Bacillus sp. OV322]SFD03435.1 Pou domain-N-terminal to homeobox domain-containing protein [Bacillus sp. OV322]
MKKFKLGKQHEELMNLLDKVPGVTEHMTSVSVIMAEKILQRRIELGLTQTQVVEIIKEQGERITQATISKVECGDSTIGTDTYDKIFHALGVIDINLEYGELPKSSKRILELV